MRAANAVAAAGGAVCGAGGAARAAQVSQGSRIASRAAAVTRAQLRTEDPDDRRRVLVETAGGKDPLLNQAFAPLLRATLRYLGKYSEKDLRKFTEFVKGALPLFQAVTREKGPGEVQDSD